MRPCDGRPCQWKKSQDGSHNGIAGTGKVVTEFERTGQHWSNNSLRFFLKGRCRRMNQKISACSSAVNFIAVLCFAISMLLGLDDSSYFFSMFIAFSFVAMTCGYAYFAETDVKLAGFVSVAFSAIYAAIILLVYFAQLTTVRFNHLTQQAAALLDFQQCGLLFNYDLLGYGVMSLAAFFAGLTIKPQAKTEQWLKYLLMVHGVFFISCFTVPMLDVFKADHPKWIGIAVLEFWCLYFCPISILSFLHFSNCREWGLAGKIEWVSCSVWLKHVFDPYKCFFSYILYFIKATHGV